MCKLVIGSKRYGLREVELARTSVFRELSLHTIERGAGTGSS